MVSEVFTRFTDFANREIEVASGEMTMPEVAAAFTRVLGKNVAYQQIPFAAFEQQAGARVNAPKWGVFRSIKTRIANLIVIID